MLAWGARGSGLKSRRADKTNPTITNVYEVETVELIARKASCGSPGGVPNGRFRRCCRGMYGRQILPAYVTILHSFGRDDYLPEASPIHIEMKTIGFSDSIYCIKSFGFLPRPGRALASGAAAWQRGGCGRTNVGQDRGRRTPKKVSLSLEFCPRGSHESWCMETKIGVKGMTSKPWRRRLRSAEDLAKWAEKNDAEIHGTRILEDSERVQANRR